MYLSPICMYECAHEGMNACVYECYNDGMNVSMMVCIYICTTVGARYCKHTQLHIHALVFVTGWFDERRTATS